MKYDGIDHINIYSKAITPIGRILSNWSPCEIHNEYGSFRCLEGLIFYMGSYDPVLKNLLGYEAKKYGESVDKGRRIKEEDFRNIIIKAMKQKWEQIPYALKVELCIGRFAKLPLTHYYEYQGKRIVPDKWAWQIEEWEKLRKEFKNKLSL